mmetsp:Transcript_14960/g.36739  ORF Transcript_14960/g.36739 Transcript_14960/m.36739 type:complete len:266 (-) Transcript_14960:125-922(-)
MVQQTFLVHFQPHLVMGPVRVRVRVVRQNLHPCVLVVLSISIPTTKLRERVPWCERSLLLLLLLLTRSSSRSTCRVIGHTCDRTVRSSTATTSEDTCSQSFLLVLTTSNTVRRDTTGTIIRRIFIVACIIPATTTTAIVARTVRDLLWWHRIRMLDTYRRWRCGVVVPFRTTCTSTTPTFTTSFLLPAEHYYATVMTLALTLGTDSDSGDNEAVGEVGMILLATTVLALASDPFVGSTIIDSFPFGFFTVKTNNNTNNNTRIRIE